MSGNIVGNVYDKYGTKNPVARHLVARFLGTITAMYREVAPRTVLEVGCGEGRLAQHLIDHGGRPERFDACDLSLDRVAPDSDPLISFREASIYDLPYRAGEFDLVLCCEVLEHLEDPERALDAVARVTGRAAIFSTPREPLWRLLNMARGKYLEQWGNTPGHIQHFGKRDLVRLVERAFTVHQVASPTPWTVLLARPRRS